MDIKILLYILLGIIGIIGVVQMLYIIIISTRPYESSTEYMEELGLIIKEQLTKNQDKA